MISQAQAAQYFPSLSVSFSVETLLICRCIIWLTTHTHHQVYLKVDLGQGAVWSCPEKIHEYLIQGLTKGKGGCIEFVGNERCDSKVSSRNNMLERRDICYSICMCSPPHHEAELSLMKHGRCHRLFGLFRATVRDLCKLSWGVKSNESWEFRGIKGKHNQKHELLSHTVGNLCCCVKLWPNLRVKLLTTAHFKGLLHYCGRRRAGPLVSAGLPFVLHTQSRS